MSQGGERSERWAEPFGAVKASGQVATPHSSGRSPVVAGAVKHCERDFCDSVRDRRVGIASTIRSNWSLVRSAELHARIWSRVIPWSGLSCPICSFLS